MQNQINSNKSFKIRKLTKVPKYTDVDRWVTQCNNCFTSCHTNCRFDGENKHKCVVLLSGSCEVCKGKCGVAAHVNSTRIITMIDKEEFTDNTEMKAKYVNAASKKSHYEQIKDGLEAEIETKKIETLNVHLQIQECFEALDKIALVSNVYDNDKYFDQLIKSEENKD